eukprot:scaffold37254_cov16-Prasinocladus_malaysianus.AAC.1
MPVWICKDISHYTESFMLLVGEPTMDFDVDIRSEADNYVTDLALMANLSRIWQRLQGATTYRLRDSRQNRVLAGADRADIDEANGQHEHIYERFVADIRTPARMIERHLPTNCCKYVLYIATCRLPRLLQLRGYSHNENWMDQFMGSIKGGVKSAHAVLERITNDVLLDQHLGLVQQHPAYNTYEGFMSAGQR